MRNLFLKVSGTLLRGSVLHALTSESCDLTALTKCKGTHRTRPYLQIVVDAQQVMLLELEADVFCREDKKQQRA